VAGRGTPATALLAKQQIAHTVHVYSHDPRRGGYGLEASDALGIAPEIRLLLRAERPDADPATLVASGWADARRKIEDYVTAGLTKFVIRPGSPPDDPGQFAADFAREMMPLQN